MPDAVGAVAAVIFAAMTSFEEVLLGENLKTPWVVVIVFGSEGLFFSVWHSYLGRYGAWLKLGKKNTKLQASAQRKVGKRGFFIQS
jgi:hypothetical protein